MQNLTFTHKATKDLSELDKNARIRILDKLFQKNTSQLKFEKLKNSDLHKVRIGDYRVIVEIKENEITIHKIGHRRRIYDKI